jgi:hypothetical protein
MTSATSLGRVLRAGATVRSADPLERVMVALEGGNLKRHQAQVWLLQECLSSLVRGQLLQRLGLYLHPLQIAGKVPSQEDVE